jgi:hypothetical protein
MLKVTATNRFIACKPFISLAVEKEVKGNVAFAKQKNALMETEVVLTSLGLFGNELTEYKIGDKIYLDGEEVKGHAWSRKVYAIGPEPVSGQKDERVHFILVPEMNIRCVGRE